MIIYSTVARGMAIPPMFIKLNDHARPFRAAPVCAYKYILLCYENGKVLPPIDRLAALARAYDISLASLVVSHDALIPLVTMLERATAPQIGALALLLHQVLDHTTDEQ